MQECFSLWKLSRYPFFIHFTRCHFMLQTVVCKYCVLCLPSADGGDVVKWLEHPLLQAPPPRGRLGLVEQPEQAEALLAPSLLSVK